MCREMNIEYVSLKGAGIVAVGNSSGRIESGRSNSGRMICIRTDYRPNQIKSNGALVKKIILNVYLMKAICQSVDVIKVNYIYSISSRSESAEGRLSVASIYGIYIV